jgi:hypothetical protein
VKQRRSGSGLFRRLASPAYRAGAIRLPRQLSLTLAVVLAGLVMLALSGSLQAALVLAPALLLAVTLAASRYPGAELVVRLSRRRANLPRAQRAVLPRVASLALPRSVELRQVSEPRAPPAQSFAAV